MGAATVLKGSQDLDRSLTNLPNSLSVQSNYREGTQVRYKLLTLGITAACLCISSHPAPAQTPDLYYDILAESDAYGGGDNNTAKYTGQTLYDTFSVEKAGDYAVASATVGMGQLSLTTFASTPLAIQTYRGANSGVVEYWQDYATVTGNGNGDGLVRLRVLSHGDWTMTGDEKTQDEWYGAGT
jgi:hypothetical protein